MNLTQALFVARKVLVELRDTEFISYEEEEFEKRYGVSHAQVVNAMPIIEALETVEGAKRG